jgi:hypothetical protein
MWLDAEGLQPEHGYFDRGPHQYTSDEGLPTFEYHWTLADHVQAVVDAGCRILRVDEHGEGVADEDWIRADLSKLPGYVTIVGRKPSGLSSV